MDELQDSFKVSERRACELVGQPRSSQRYEEKIRDDEGSLVKAMLHLVKQFPRYGYRRITAKLRQADWDVNPKRVYRLWRREGLKVPKHKRPRRGLGTTENGCDRRRAEQPNDVWCWDFVFNRTTSGSLLKWLSIIDEYTRECLTLHVDRSITSENVIDHLAALSKSRGLPHCIRSDNGPEFVSGVIRDWLERLEVETLYIAPGRPWENGYAESFHSRLRDEFLSLELFENLAAARGLTMQWRTEYNDHRPHSSLGYLPPSAFASQCAASASVAALPPLQQHTAEDSLLPLPQPVLS